MKHKDISILHIYTLIFKCLHVRLHADHTGRLNSNFCEKVNTLLKFTNRYQTIKLLVLYSYRKPSDNAISWKTPVINECIIYCYVLKLTHIINIFIHEINEISRKKKKRFQVECFWCLINISTSNQQMAS